MQLSHIRGIRSSSRVLALQEGTHDGPPSQSSNLIPPFSFPIRLNEKQLRDAAGPLTAADMAGLFNPVPFGVPRESPLQQLREDPAAAAVWESFRNIDPDKEARVLQKWEEYNRALRAAEASGPSREESLAAVALRQWSTVSKTSRVALRKANLHSVAVLEVQVLQLMEQVRAHGHIEGMPRIP